MSLAFLPPSDVINGYSSIINDFDVEDNELINYFERVWIGEKKGRGMYYFKRFYCTPLVLYYTNLGSRRTKPKFNLQLWNVYERVIQDLPRSNNAIEGWHNAFNNRVSIKHPSITKLAKCILREQSKFEIDIERLRTGQQPNKRKKFMKILMHD